MKQGTMLFWSQVILLVFCLTIRPLAATPRLLPGIKFTPEEVLLIAKKYGENFDMVENLRAQQILLNALEASPQVSWRCKLNEPVLPGKLSARQCVFLRYVAPDGFVFRQQDCFDDKGKPQQSYVENRRGQFAKIRGRWVKISEILALWHLDALSEGFNPAEIADSVYSVRDADYRGIPCHEVSMRTLPDFRMLSRQVKEMPLFVECEKGREWNTEIGKNRPMLRIFLIDKTNGFIYSREHFNISGARLYSRNTGITEIGCEFTEKQFDPDGKIEGDFLFPDEADNELFKQQQASKPRKPETRQIDDEAYYPWYSRIADQFSDDRVMRGILIVMRVGAVVLVALAIVLKIRQK